MLQNLLHIRQPFRAAIIPDRWTPPQRFWNKILLLFLVSCASCGSSATAATTAQLVQREGWRGLLCCNEVPDRICKYCCPDYCKKPLPQVCGPLPPYLSCGCGPQRWWSVCTPGPHGCQRHASGSAKTEADCGCDK